MKWIGHAFVLFGLFLVFHGTFGSSRQLSLASLAGALLLATPCLAVGAWLIRRAGERQQDERDRAVQEIIRDRTSKLFLYLRPFDTTNRFRLSGAYLNFFSWETWERDGYDDIERVVSRTLEPTHPLIALGKPGEHRGAARALTDEASWKSVVLDLVDRAQLVVVVPGPNAGTIWELEQLTNRGTLGKCLFIMPPSNSTFYRSEDTELPTKWEAARAKCQGFGLMLPKYDADGGLFRYASGASMEWRFAQFPHPDPVEWRDAFQMLLNTEARPSAKSSP